jgi:hypothetical protein
MRVDHDAGDPGADELGGAPTRRAEDGTPVPLSRGQVFASGLALASVLVGAALVVLGVALSCAPRESHGIGLDLPLHAGTSGGSAADAATTSARTTHPATGPVDAVSPALRASASASVQPAPRDDVSPPRDTARRTAEGPPVGAPQVDAPPRPEPVEPRQDEHARQGPVSPPTGVDIVRIGVSSGLIDLDLDDRGHLEVPQDPAVAGWWIGGPRPGQAGPAVIVGHVDSVDGPAVFHGLPRLEAGDEIVVHRADDTEVRFAVERVERWPKDAFPTDAVYRDADGAELRLITCGGRFDRASLRYLDNVIVFARESAGDPRAPEPPS